MVGFVVTGGKFGAGVQRDLRVCRRWRTRATERVGIRCAMSEENGEALLLQAMYGDQKKIAELIDDGVDVNFSSKQNESGMTALMWAASEGHVETARLLLKAGADVNASNCYGYTPILYAFENAPHQKLSEIPPAGFPSIPGKETTEQMKVIKRETGHIGVAKQLIIANADRSVLSPVTGDSVLHLAARRGYLGMVDLLTDLGIDINIINRGYNHTPLHEAALNGHEYVVKLLIKKGADLNAQNRVGWTPLIWAAAKGDESIVQILCQAGADISLKGAEQGKPRQRTTDALREAMKVVDGKGVVKILRQHGAK